MKQAEVCVRYHINAGRSATSIVATDSVFILRGSLKMAVLFMFINLRKELKRIEKNQKLHGYLERGKGTVCN